MTENTWPAGEAVTRHHRLRRPGRLRCLSGVVLVAVTSWGAVDGAASVARAAQDLQDDAEEPRGLRLNTAAAMPGYVLFNPLRSPTTYLVDREGRVVHTWEGEVEPGGGLYLLDNGHLLRGVREPDVAVFSGGGQAGRLQELTWDGDLVWDFTFASEKHLLHHDIAVMPNGNILAIAWERKSAEEAAQAGRLAALTPEAGLWPDMIVEFEPQPPDGARIVWEWHMWDRTIQDHNPAAENFGDPAAHPERIDLNAEREPPEMSADDRKRVETLGCRAGGPGSRGGNVGPPAHQRGELQRRARPDRHERPSLQRDLGDRPQHDHRGGGGAHRWPLGPWWGPALPMGEPAGLWAR